jgi:hypothetical protein
MNFLFIICLIKVISLLLKLKWWELSIEEIRKLVSELSGPPNTSKLNELIRIYR